MLKTVSGSYSICVNLADVSENISTTIISEKVVSANSSITIIPEN